MDMQQVRRVLEARRVELRGRALRAAEDRRHVREPLMPDFADQAVQRSNDEVLERIQDSADSELQQIDQALARLDGGHYGRCARCGGPIAPRRLEAVPYAIQCSACAGLQP
jgi:RNA polymerase-binding protein DksA